MKQINLSFVIPCYRSEASIEEVLNEIEKTVAQRSKYAYEVIAVNDCSPDQVLQVLKRRGEDMIMRKVISL